MQYFNGKIYIEPSSGAKIITNVAPTPNLLSSGVVAVIGESEGGLTMEDGVVYESTKPNFLKTVLRDGVAKRCIDLIFSPSSVYNGAQKVLFIRAQKATVATATITQSTGGSVTFVMTTKDKGLYLSDATNGLKWKLIAGVVDTAKEILQLQLDGVTIWSSPEVGTYQDLIDAIEADDFAKTVISGAVTVGTATTAIDASVRTSSFAVFTGGTSPSMVGDDVDDALALLAPFTPNILFIASEDATFHAKLLAFANTVSEQPIQCFFGGALDETEAQVKARALTFNAENAFLAYPNVILPKEDGSGSEIKSPMYLAAIGAGLRAGLPPFQPLTYKAVNVLGFDCVAGELDKDAREELIRAGVMYFRNIPGVGFACNKGVNTLQTNASMIYKKTDGEATSPESSIIAIKYQLIRELVVNSTSLFVGGTVATVSKEDVINFTKNYLETRTSKATEPNLLIKWNNVTAELVDDAWFVYWDFVPNTPINHVFHTGAMLRP